MVERLGIRPLGFDLRRTKAPGQAPQRDRCRDKSPMAVACPRMNLGTELILGAAGCNGVFHGRFSGVRHGYCMGYCHKIFRDTPWDFARDIVRYDGICDQQDDVASQFIAVLMRKINENDGFTSTIKIVGGLFNHTQSEV